MPSCVCVHVHACVASGHWLMSDSDEGMLTQCGLRRRPAQGRPGSSQAEALVLAAAQPFEPPEAAVVEDAAAIDEDAAAHVAAPAPAVRERVAWCAGLGMPGPKDRTRLQHYAILKIARLEKQVLSLQKDEAIDEDEADPTTVLDIARSSGKSVTALSRIHKQSRTYVANAFQSVVCATCN